jgi:hypothetical protein
VRKNRKKKSLIPKILRFYPSVAKKIAYDIIHAELHDQEYDEEDAKSWSLVLADKIRDALRSNRLNLICSLNFFYLLTFVDREYEYPKI